MLLVVYGLRAVKSARCALKTSIGKTTASTCGEARLAGPDLPLTATVGAAILRYLKEYDLAQRSARSF